MQNTTAHSNDSNNTATNTTPDFTPGIFIIPNPAPRLGSFISDYMRWDVAAACRKAGHPLPSMSDDQVVVQVWACSPNCDNWGSHRWEGERLPWTSYLPLESLKGLKEGDTLRVLNPAGEPADLEVSQLGFRYRRFGTFEETLAKVTKHLS